MADTRCSIHHPHIKASSSIRVTKTTLSSATKPGTAVSMQLGPDLSRRVNVSLVFVFFYTFVCLLFPFHPVRHSSFAKPETFRQHFPSVLFPFCIWLLSLISATHYSNKSWWKPFLLLWTAAWACMHIPFPTSTSTCINHSLVNVRSDMSHPFTRNAMLQMLCLCERNFLINQLESYQSFEKDYFV
jgi:hypothetical protein